jgi:hypothetical protein
MKTQQAYYATRDRNGTEDEITIHAPDGRAMAFIWFWDEPDELARADADAKKADARLIVDALNAYTKGA